MDETDLKQGEVAGVEANLKNPKLPKPYYQDDYVTLYHADCREILPLLEPVDLVLTDPPYGVNWNTNSKRFSGGSKDSKSKRGVGRDWGAPIVGDDKDFDPTPFLSYPHVILFGFNNYLSKLPRGSVLVWIKRNDAAFNSFLSDAEIAWQKGGSGVYCYRDLSLAAEANFRLHPTQKPLPLMKWCIKRSKATGIILDPFTGSGTTLRAAKDLGRKAIGVEIEEKYCEVAANRLRQEVLGL